MQSWPGITLLIQSLEAKWDISPQKTGNLHPIFRFLGQNTFESISKPTKKIINKMVSVISYLFFLFSLAITAASSVPPRTWTTRLSLNNFRLPILPLCKKYPVLLDTGSKDSWLAGPSCLDCPLKASVCPLGGEDGQEIKYFRGSVRGELSFVSTCLGLYRFVCATHVEGMERVGAVGILGLKGATGKGVIKAMLQNQGIQKEAFGIYQGHQENQLFLGQIPTEFAKDELKVAPNGEEWQVKLEGMNICGIEINKLENYSIFFDTGSNILILPSAAYEQGTTVIIQEMRKLGCSQQAQPFTFSCPPRTITQEAIVLKTSEKSQVRLPLKEMLQIQDQTFKFRIQKGSGTAIAVGGALMRDYIVSFHLDGKLTIHIANKELLHSEVGNFKVVLLEYALLAIGLAFLSKKGYQVAEVAINRKIVI